MNLISLKNNSKSQIILHIFIWFFFILASLMQFYESPFKIGNDFFCTMGDRNCPLLFELLLFRSQHAFAKKALAIFCDSHCFDDYFYSR